MNRQEAKSIITTTFNSEFKEENFQKFIANLLKEYKPDKTIREGQYIRDAYSNTIRKYKIIGQYTDHKDSKIDILEVALWKNQTLDRARTAQRNFVADYLKRADKQAALVAFVTPNNKDWRLSFVKLDYSLELKNSKLTSKEEITPAKRQSFLVGENEGSHTAQSQFIDLLMNDKRPSQALIEAAFNIETVTKEFFNKYKELFHRLQESIESISKEDKLVKEEFSKKNISVSDFAKKTLGQIVFLYFLQKKGWFGVESNQTWGDGNKRFMKWLFDHRKSFTDYKTNFFNDILEPFFYEGLSTDLGSDCIYDRLSYNKIKYKMPFLNGGLFAPMNDYSWKLTDIIIPDELFSNDKATKEGDVGDGILDVFNRYNFTVNENEPLEKDVAVDPEMLGKVFENLLEVKDRKSKGSFYTPREIVHYMCQETLINYINKETKQELPLEDIEFFIRKGHMIIENDSIAIERIQEKKKKGFEYTGVYKLVLPEKIRDKANELNDLLKNIKIADPAVGSGAFPLGMITEIVRARKVLGIYLEESISDYDIKLHAIAHSIHGVDIDPGAVEIAKLRLWLTLLIEAQEPHPLPNLEHKIVQGDSLVESYHGMKIFDDNAIGMVKSTPSDNKATPKEQDLFGLEVEKSEVELKLEKLQLKIDAFLTESSKTEKTKLKKEIDDLKWNLIEVSLKENNQLNKLGELKELRDKNIFPFFIWKLEFSDVFMEKGGFDVVIGNPPYVQIQKFSGQQCQKDWQAENFETFAKTGDIYSLFYEKGNRILRDKGVLAFITSNKWMRANYGKATRKYFLENVNIDTLIDFGDSQLFENATTYTNILIFTKEIKQSKPHTWDLSKSYQSDSSLEQMLNENACCKDIFTENSFIILPSEIVSIKNKIEKLGSPLKDWKVSINYGIKTGFNEAFIITGEKKDELIAKDPKSAEIIKPILRGRDIKRYKAEFADKWLINTHNGYLDVNTGTKILPINIENYPAIKYHLDEYWEKIEKRYDKGVTPYNLRNCAYINEFEKEKIIWIEMSPISNFTLSKSFILNTAYIMQGKSIKYLLPILNSTLISWYFPIISTDVRGNTRRYIKQYVEQLPIPKLSPQKQQPFEILVDCILFSKEHELETEAQQFEWVIDNLVYDLYFEKEMKEANCYITDRITEVVKPFKEDDTDEFKIEYIKQLYNFCKNDKTVFRGLIHSRNVKVVKTITESNK